MKYYVAQSPQTKVDTSYYEPANKSLTLSIELVLALVMGGIGAIGIPKLLSLYGTEKIENVKAERRRDDSVYQTLFASLESMMKSMTEMNRTMAAGQSSSSSESFQLMATLVQEISLMREVVSNNTNVMEQLRDMNEALTQEIHFLRVASTEMQEQVSVLKAEMHDITRKM